MPLTLRSVLAVVVLFSQTACHSELSQNRDSGSERHQAAPPAANVEAKGGAEDAAVLPLVMIDVGGKAIAQGKETAGVLKVVESHDGSLREPSSSQPSLQSSVSVEIHGDTSTGLAKKSYRFELIDDKQEERELALLGLPAGSDWVLHSCGSDRTCLRNVLAYSLAREFGRYAPRTRFIELFINGDYQGIYVLVERVRRDSNRVDLPRPAATSADGDISGGYIFKMDMGEGTPGDAVPRDWVSPVDRTIYSYLYPRFNQISAAQKAYLHDHLSRFEAMMRGPSWNDASIGYRQWLDVPSWVDFALIQELSVNPDSYAKSVHFQKWPQAMGNKIALGPVWDFDLAFGAAEFRDSRNTQTWAHDMNRFGTVPVRYNPPNQVPFVPPHWVRLWSDPAFHRDLKCRWQELRKGPLQVSELNARIDGWAAQLATAQPRDGALWGNPPANAYAGEVATLKQFLAKRTAWMDASLPGRCPA